MGEAKAVCLTAACHQRSSWRLRRELAVPVHAPEGARTLDEEPDEVYGDDELLPGGLRAVYTPGPEDWHYCFLLEREPSVLFCSDLLMSRRGGLAFVPLRYHDDPEKTRASVRRLLELDFEILCLDHGRPITHDPHLAIRELLAQA